MKIDLHIHSIASGHALNTVDEISAYAEKCGMTHIAITDHGPAMEGAPHGGYFEVSEMVSPKRNDLKIYMGIEANILDLEGTIDLHDPYYSMQKIISAGIHEKTGFSGNSLQDNTEALLAVIKKKRCQIITHPWGECFPVDMETVTKAAIANGILLELNDRVFRYPTVPMIKAYKKMIDIIKKAGGFFIVGSDSHVKENIGNDSHIMALKDELGLTLDNAINNYANELEEIFDEKQNNTISSTDRP